ncbi:RNA polymerase III transcription factor (TF)IIIC subunit [Musa troglodytarum]|uniref:RNA polymerase III transcription factor (TF)IIIC subunit n=1 Tax=Musa troglodytarum TaxID=320322 RepID=A0A9E7I3P7_9LILI|nr:RNA polymerase III transcription factor (TF)IIIC subunit [Musa troglodytarum]
MMVPPLFSLKDRPEKIVYIRIPEKFNWEDHISRDNPEWEWQVAVAKLFDEKPIWPRWSFHERLLDDGQQVSENQLKRLLFRAGYYFSTGPYGRFWIRKVCKMLSGALRRLPYVTTEGLWLKQTQKELCHFQHTTGWFSGAILRTLRLHVSIRFLSLYPNDAAKQLTNYTRELFERSKKNGALSKLQKSEKEDQLVNRDTNCSAEVTSIHSSEHGHMDQDRTDNCEIEDEEEEEEFDGYESPPACEDGFFPDGDYEDKEFPIYEADNPGEQISNDYLEELLRGFPFNKESKDRRPDEAPGAGDSDGEYQIFEQDSEDNENFLDD